MGSRFYTSARAQDDRCRPGDSPDHRGSYELARDEIEADGATYEDALKGIHEQLRPGWRGVSSSWFIAVLLSGPGPGGR